MTVFGLFIVWALASAIIAVVEWVVDPPDGRLVPRCGRCDKLREWRHRCLDADSADTGTGIDNLSKQV